ncbi:OmpP1/FadL family transporter [Tuwongella immobilis]|uniref:Long-chain fatty acid transport protein n=1 Tax=Tuwongella immobilis TaxID=692036 RepID=A0A6C2YR81_9BACT|nr:outer membrane protein transport protein [Tuwongella immobilis]VIP03382.1 Membrane protein involved in aromatic hydrocarbon degradation OS=Rhodopirellula baltica SH28 GN=RBSH_00689 PE=4 SV=1: Toluene_X [Tuwongella immobilis]VTS04136.1 Membrane protein involved in aromatic hydrocarbon degradation OS=Rhodopirellula baltica SH28 GN=RBSH_00689 PE=4 SV=1: Toluene_X [Tuwongella immobilis]
MRFGMWNRIWILAAVIIAGTSTQARAQPGFLLPGGGAAHAGMAGVSTAAPVDAIGALYWNPAAIGRLGRSEVSIGGSFIYPDISVSSSFPRPLQRRVDTGRTRSDNGFPLTSSLGVVYQPEDERMTYGLGLFTLGGGGVNYPADANNPILSPTGPLRQNVLGPIYSNLTILQLAPTAAYKLTDRLTIGAGPTVDVTLPSFDPAFFAPPDDANGDGIGTFPAATHARPFWGGGFRLGIQYALDDWDFGFGYTSPQWLETWQFHARDELGNRRDLSLKASLPAIYSWGIAYHGIERLNLGLDLRYVDYANTDLYGTSVRDGGLGWDSSFVVALGGQYQVSDRIALQAGYQYNTNPLSNTSTLFNVQGPAIVQNTISFGTTVAISESLSMSLGYAYGFNNSVTGTAREIPNATIEMEASSHSLLFGLQVKFGASKPTASTVCPTCESTSAMRIDAPPLMEQPAR